MIEEVLIQYGALGIMVIYLMYNQQVTLRALTKAINKQTSTLALIGKRT